MKPIETLRAEFVRVLGAVPPLLEEAAFLLDVPQARWSGEPTLSSFALHTVMRAGYASCGTYVSVHEALLAASDQSLICASCIEMRQQT